MTFYTWQKWAMAIALATIVLCVGSMTAQDLTEDANRYCEGVYNETWPDYKKIFKKECDGWLTEHSKAVN